jgi:hypothetical protein
MYPFSRHPPGMQTPSIVVIRTGPTNVTKVPKAAFGPFPSEADAEDWLRHNTLRWSGQGQSWDHFTLRLDEP